MDVGSQQLDAGNEGDNGPPQCPVIHSSTGNHLGLTIPHNHPEIQIKSTTFLGAKLQPGVTTWNIISYILAVFVSIMFFVYLNASTAFLLSDVIEMPKDMLGRAAGNLSFADELYVQT